MKINKAGLDLIRKFEGCELSTYKDQAGVYTIGYGHTGTDVRPPPFSITKQKAEELLKADVARFERGVEALLKHPVNENQFSALICFSFNLGLTALEHSTLLKRVNVGDFVGAANQFEKWCLINGNRSQGLINRRLAEKSLFESTQNIA